MTHSSPPIFSLTGFPAPEKRHLLQSYTSSSLPPSSYSPSLTSLTTILVCHTSLTDKYKMAMKQDIPCVTPQYIHSSIKAQKFLDYEAFRCPALYNLKICCTGFPEDERMILQRSIEAAGGIYHASLIRDDTTHLVIAPGAESSAKARGAQDWGGIRMVRAEWVRESVSRSMGLDEEGYEVMELKKRMIEASNGSSSSAASEGNASRKRKRQDEASQKRGDSDEWLKMHNRQPPENFTQLDADDDNNAEESIPVREILQPLPPGWRPESASTQEQSLPSNSHETANAPSSTHPDGTNPAAPVSSVPQNPSTHPPATSHNPRRVYLRDHFSLDNDLLEKCTVYLLGFSEYPAVLQRTVQLLSQHGAVRLPQLIPHRLTHIIVYKPTDDELLHLQNSFLLSDLGISVVMYRWLEDSVHEGVMLSEAEYLFL